MTNFPSKFIEALYAPISQFINPDTRIYLPYIISSFLIALLYYYTRSATERKGKGLISYLFPKKIWLHPSAKQDYFIFLINSILFVSLILPFIASSTAIFSVSYKGLKYLFGNIEMINLGQSNTLILYTVFLWLLGDFSRFFIHYIMHKIPSLWEFHKVHHSAEVLTPLTQYRSHPIEVLLFSIRAVLTIGFTTALFTFLFSYDLSVIEVIGVNFFRFIFLSLGANLRHSHIPIRYGRILEHLFISPAQHQIHHSTKSDHFDTNLGSHLAIWDWLFGTLKISKSKHKLHFGLDSSTKRAHRSLLKVYFQPFVEAYKKIRRL